MNNSGDNNPSKYSVFIVLNKYKFKYCLIKSIKARP